MPKTTRAGSSTAWEEPAASGLDQAPEGDTPVRESVEEPVQESAPLVLKPKRSGYRGSAAT